MDKLTERIANYCKKMTGQDMVIKALDKSILGKLPLTITGSYYCYESELMGVPIILMEVRNDDYTPKQLQKHQVITTRLIGRHAVFVMDHAKSYHLSRMVESAVNFIIPNKQIYVPSLLVNLREVKDGRKLDEEIMPGIAQCILLTHLQRENLNGFTTLALAEKFSVSYASMNRAIRWLECKGLVKTNGVKEKVLAMAEKGKMLWDKALPLLPSPIERIVYTDEEIIDKPDAGESALGELTMLAAPEISCKAVSKLWAKEHKDILNRNYGDYIVEVWRYDPMLIEKNNMVDPLSLYLSLQNSDDERVRMELKNLMNSVIWLED